jgi:hypothetical protein
MLFARGCAATEDITTASMSSSACSLSLAHLLSLFSSLANSSTVASARTEAVAASPLPLWHKAGAVQESVAAVLAKLEAGIVSGVVQVPFFLLCGSFCCSCAGAVKVRVHVRVPSMHVLMRSLLQRTVPRTQDAAA